jgi:hypothetical protein
MLSSACVDVPIQLAGAVSFLSGMNRNTLESVGG